MLGGCSWDARECPVNAAQDAQGMLPRMLGRCSPRCSRDARGMLGKCSPAYSGDSRGMLTGRLREGARGCSGGARRDVRGCSGARPACSPLRSVAAPGCAQGMLLGMLLRCCPGCSGGARGCRGVLTAVLGDVCRLPRLCCRVGPVVLVRLHAPCRAERSCGAGGREAAGRGGGGVSSPALPQARLH